MSKALMTTMHEIVWLMDKHAETLLKLHYGISYSWFHLMLVLEDAQPTTQHNLAVCLDYSDAAVSRLLERLRKEKLVEVKIDPNHKRKRIVTLSKTGLKTTTQASHLLEAEFRLLVKKSKTNIKEYDAMSTRLVKTLKEDR